MLVRARQAFISTLPGHPDTVIGPADILRDTNPHVVAHRGNFEEVTPTVGFGDVEEATARPGERRSR